MADEFSPKLQSSPRGERPVEAARRPADEAPPAPRGEISPAAPANQLLPATNPGIIPEQPRIGMLDESLDMPDDDTLGSVARILAGVASIANQGAGLFEDNRSEEDRTNDALRPYASELNNIKTGLAQGQVTGGIAKARALTRKYITLYPNEANTIKNIYQNVIGGETASPVVNPQDANMSGFQDWLSQTADGRSANAQVSQGLVSPQEADSYLYARYSDYQADQAYAEVTSIRKQTAQDNETLLQLEDTKTLRRLGPRHDLIVSEVISQITSLEFSDGLSDEAVSEETLQTLYATREALRQEFAVDYQGNLTGADVYSPRIEESLSTLSNVITAIETSGESIRNMEETLGSQSVINLVRAFEEDPVFGQISALPEVMDRFVEGLITTNQVDMEEAVRAATAKLRAGVVTSDVTTENATNSPDPNDHIDRDYVFELSEDEDTRRSVQDNALNNLRAFDPAKQKDLGHDATADLVASMIAPGEILGGDTFEVAFLDNVDRFAQLTSTKDERGIKTTQVLNSFAVQQMRLNKQDMDHAMESLPAGFTLIEEGGLFLIDYSPEAFERADDGSTERVKALLKSEGLAATPDNIEYVIMNGSELVSQGALNSRDPMRKTGFRGGTGLGAMKQDLSTALRRLERLNDISTFANSIPEVAEMFAPNVEQMFTDGFNTPIPTPGLTTEQQEQLNSYPEFSSEGDVDLALINGEIEEGEIIRLNGEYYRAEFDNEPTNENSE